jgi:hypothetical protein
MKFTRFAGEFFYFVYLYEVLCRILSFGFTLNL